ncbi:amidase [Chthonobacter albigriseus]|uniref:amidase n=1 Tax=Chthonobacter albigriseus TaxID=1683161 RepID=UPI0015EEB66E|nr:amidase [Chthonobacter albigriseus]
MTDLCTRSLAETAADIKSGALSPVELTRAMLARIEAVDPGLNSYLTVTPDLALKQAAKAEAEIRAGQYRGSMHGIPIALKDLCNTKGITTSAGMSIHRGFVPEADGTIVGRLAAAGAVLLGKLHMTEGATLEHHPEFPRPTNPWRADLWTGVSSSGSGVATAAGLCFASIGSDTGGSIRFPSASCSVTGLKPTWGRVSRAGSFDLAASYDTLGPMARSAADCAAMLTAIAGWDPLDGTTLSAPVPDYEAALAGVFGLRGLRIGVDWAYIAGGVTAEVLAATKAAVDTLADLGAEIVDIAFPDTAPLFERLLDAQLAEIAYAHRETYPSKAEHYGKWLKAGIDGGIAANPLTLARNAFERDRYKGLLAQTFAGVDAIVMAVNKAGTPTWDEVTDVVESDMASFMRFTAVFNATGSPTVTSPCGFTADGRPIGFQLVGRHLSEDLLLAASHAYQQATDWHLKRPPV